MFGERSNQNAIEVPPLAIQDPAAIEVLRVWAAPGSPQQLTLRTTWKDPGAWGLLLVDVARHAARAYQTEGCDVNEALDRIHELWKREWLHPTDEPQSVDPTI